MLHIDKPIAAMKVLAADDNDINREFLHGVLTPAVAELVLVEDGLQAVAAAQQKHFDVVLLDLHMPGHDGLESMQLMRNPGTENGTPDEPRPLFIAITADARKTEQDRLLAAGFDGFLTKPISAAELINSIELINEHPGHPILIARTQRHISEQLNDSAALRNMNNDRELLDKLRQKLLQEVPDTINSINALSQQQDWPAVSRLAHKLGGGAAYTGAEKLAEACQELELSESAPALARHLAHLHFRAQAMHTTVLIEQSLQHSQMLSG